MVCFKNLWKWIDEKTTPEFAKMTDEELEEIFNKAIEDSKNGN